MSGTLVKVADKKIFLASAGISEPVGLPLANLRSLVVNERELGPPKFSEGSLPGVLHGDDVRLAGYLVDGTGQKEASCLVWHPADSATARPLRSAASGRIFYRGTVSLESESGGLKRQARVRLLHPNVDQLLAPIVSGPYEYHELKRRALYLVTGDSIPCEITRIDEKGVSFKSPLSTSTFVPQDKIKAVELTLDGRGPVSLTRLKRERLLTVPRLQKENPPTHLIRSREGDYLRGRIVEMDDQKLLVEVRLKTQEVPRDRISRIIWLHPEKLAETSPGSKTAITPAKLAAAPVAMRVQALESDETRITFRPERFGDSTLSGTSDVLGACQVKLDSVDQLLFGAAIDEAATRAAYQQWKLTYAIEPKFRLEAAGKSNPAKAGTDSSLVGKPAPDFDLDLLGGGGNKFHLSGHQGKIVVLDFWATWCSHCLDSMPELVRLYGERGQDVEIVAINLEETPEQISTMLTRHKWQLPVALDRDGAVAAKYGVTAIPQTVVISREGTVVRHFIGAGPEHGRILNDAVRGLMPGKEAHGRPSVGLVKPPQRNP